MAGISNIRCCHALSILIHYNKPTEYTSLMLRCLHLNITPIIAACFGPQRTIIRESNQSNTA